MQLSHSYAGSRSLELNRREWKHACKKAPYVRSLSQASWHCTARRTLQAYTEYQAECKGDLGCIRRLLSSFAAIAVATALLANGVSARMEGVNKPELLPKEYTPVIDVAGFLTDGEEKRIRLEVESLESDKGVKLRVLAQNYPQTPGLAIKDYWGVDADTVVFVADPNTGNILNFNVGSNIDLLVPQNFWSRLAGKYGSKFYWQERGEGAAIVNAVSAIDTCFREPQSRFQCSKIQGEFGEDSSSGGFGKAFFGS